MVLIIDAFAFCQHGEQRSGKLSMSELPRLRAECVLTEGEDGLEWTGVEWTLVGGISERLNGYPTLYLTVSATVQLLCQRCLTPFPFQIKSTANILLAKDDQAADQMDALLQDDETEVIVGSKTFDVVALIEDEALLALPLSPKHEACSMHDKNGLNKGAESEKQESPFAVLKKLN